MTFTWLDIAFLAPILFGLVRGIGKGSNAFGRVFEALWGVVKGALLVLVVAFLLNLIDSFWPFMPTSLKNDSFIYPLLVQWSNDLLSLFRSKLGK